MLYVKNAPKNDLVIRGARVVDPARGVDAVLDVRVDDGVIAQLGADVEANGHRVVDAAGLVLAPAFVDPHVHLRTPGREDEESIASGTQAAAVGGFCAILAMPNTEPVVDSAAVLGALVERAQAEAEVPVGFLAAISKGSEGGELTEMGELADSGAAGFTDDGRPVVSSSLMRRALQYGAVAGQDDRRPLRGADALALGPDARGRGFGRARVRGLSVRGRERHGRPGRGACRLRRPSRARAPRLRTGVGRGRPPRPGRRSGRDGRGDAAPPRAHGRGAALARSECEDEPAAALGRRPSGAHRRLEGRDDLRSRHGSRPARPPREGGAVRGGAVRRHGSRDGVLRALHAPRRAGDPAARDAARAHVRRARPCLRARGAAHRARGRRRTSCCSTRSRRGA